MQRAIFFSLLGLICCGCTSEQIAQFRSGLSQTVAVVTQPAGAVLVAPTSRGYYDGEYVAPVALSGEVVYTPTVVAAGQKEETLHLKPVALSSGAPMDIPSDGTTTAEPVMELKPVAK